MAAVSEILLPIEVRRAEMPHCAKLHQIQSNDFWDITIFQDGGCHHLAFSKFSNFLADGVCKAEMHHCSKFRPNWSIHCGDIVIFEDGGRPPCWICLGHIWTTHKWYLVVFITVQNLVAIDAIVFIILKFQYLARLASKCLFTLQKSLILREFDPINGQQYQWNLKKVHPCTSLRRLSHQARKSANRSYL